MLVGRMKAFAVLFLAIASCSPGQGISSKETATPAPAAPQSPERLKVKVISAHPHDPSAYTQGLVWHEGSLYESAGQYGVSSLRQVDPATGEIRRNITLPKQYFAEGLARVGDRLIQLTWREGVAIVYRLSDFEKIGEHRYQGEGWGLCHDGTKLILSDGSDRLTFRDPQTFEPTGEVRVRMAGAPVDRLNELECEDGAVYANVYQTEDIVRIDPKTGEVTALIDASGLLSAADYRAGAEVLNGIAYDPVTKRFLITGKNWPLLFEVELVPSAPAPFTVSLLGDGPLVIPPGLKVDGLTVGGLSAIVRMRADTYKALIDNDGATSARLFDLQFVVTEAGPAPLPGRAPADVPRNALRLDGLNGINFDGEGLAVTPEGTLLASSEKDPSIREISAEGKTLRKFPVPPLFKASMIGGKGIRSNQGFEALALEPDGRTLWTANEGALEQDAPDDAIFGFHPVRLLRYERRGASYVPAAQLVYVVDPIERRGSGLHVRGLVDLQPLPEGGLLALEREFVAGVGMEVQLFYVSIEGATDVSGMASLAGKSFTPVRKTLLYDFAGSGFLVDNLEGMTFGPDLPGGDRTVILISDDNFEPLKQLTQIVALRLHSAVRGGS